MGDTTKEKWDTERMREHRNDWSLAADIHLFSYMQQFSQNLLSETHGTLKALDGLESDIATTCVEVSNIGNRFWALSDTQFVENRVYDDDDITSPVAPTSLQDIQTEDNETVAIQRLREAIHNGIQVVDSKFETVLVPASDSDEEDSSPHSGVILKPVNRYKDRRLPHLIGSAQFGADDTLGLRDAPSDEETEDFMSASDKANDSDSMGESEDSDIESDQTKTQYVLSQKPSTNMFDPNSLRLPGIENVQANSNASSPPSGDVFGEQGDGLFSAMANKKSTFSSWQPSDLWASEEEDEKRLGDNVRPPSANSSISSAQSSNMSEPIKKTSEDFGKSGTGRQAVLVQEDQSDLFGTKADALPPQTKEFVPAGGVKIFGGNFNPFSNRNHSKENRDEDFAPVVEQNRSEKDDGDIFVKKSNLPTKVLPTVSSNNASNKKKEISLFDDEEEDDLFSNKTSEPKAKLHPPSLPSKHISFGGNKSEPEDEDFFSNSSLFSEPKTQQSHSLFKGDLFSDYTEDLFSKLDTKKQKGDKLTSVSQSPGNSLFSDEEPLTKALASRETGVKVPFHKTQPQKLDKDIFVDGEDLFGNVGIMKDDLFGDTPTTTTLSSTLTSNGNAKAQGSKSFKKDIFDESHDDNDELFNTSTKSSTTDRNPKVNQGSLFGNKNYNLLKSVKQELVVNENDLFGAATISSDIKGRPSVLKHKKKSEKHSLFDSDSDDDLFSSPQGSLSSRKSFQSTSEPSENNDIDDKKKSSKNSTGTRLPKTDFSSIFSNSLDETPVFLQNNEKSSNLFGEDVDLFSSLSSKVKTPELFSNNKLLTKPEKHSSQESKEKENTIQIKTESEDIKSKPIVEALNKEITEKSEKSPVQSDLLKTDIFSDSLGKNEEETPIVKKLEPPKTLDIKPITETLMGDQMDEPKSKKNTVDIHKPPVSKKPSPDVLIEKSVSKDSTDGEVISPRTPSKVVPGKLKASQMIKINPATLLPGARPSKSESTSEPLMSTISDVKDVPESAVSPSQIIPTIAPAMPPKSSLLQSVNKERVKIQGKRRPSSRRARQEALRASSLDAVTEADGIGTSIDPPTSNLMSPSTDEEDLFGVPPLDVVYDVKTVSPSVDIFGTPTVLSPVTHKELPSTFVSTPFVHSQPPPLEEEQEEVSNQEDDLFGSQSNLISRLTKENKPSEEVKQVPLQKGIAAEDIFSDLEEDGLFRGIKEAPPPLVDDDNDEDEEYDELFMPRKKIDHVFTKPSHSGSVIAALESIPQEDTIRSRSSRSTESSSHLSTADSQKVLGFEKDNLFPSKDSLFPSKNNLFPTSDLMSSNTESIFSSMEEPNVMISDDPLFDKSNKHISEITKDTFDNSSKKPSDSSLGDSANVKESKKDTIFSDSCNEDEFSLFVKPQKVLSSELFQADKEIPPRSIPHKCENISKNDSIFSHSGNEEDSFLFAKGKNESSSELFLAGNKISRTIPDKLEPESKEDENRVSDELFGSVGKLSTPKSPPVSNELKNTIVKTKDERTTKKDTLFGEDEEETSNLFPSVSDRKVKVKPSKKSSLFGDEDDDDDDIFGSLSSNKRIDSKSAPLARETMKGSSSKATRTGNSGFSKPVKLETKQTFSDPLLSQEDQ